MRAPSSPCRRRAFSLLEVLVATTILGGGVLAVAAGATRVMQSIGDGARHTLAATAAMARLELLAAQPCHAIANGRSSTRSIDVDWTAAPLSDDVRVLAISVSARYPTRDTHARAIWREYTIRGAVACY